MLYLSYNTLTIWYWSSTETSPKLLVVISWLFLNNLELVGSFGTTFICTFWDTLELLTKIVVWNVSLFFVHMNLKLYWPGLLPSAKV